MHKLSALPIKFQVQPAQIGQPFWQGIRFFITNRAWLVFLITLFINGVAAGVGNNFLFLYLDELAASEVLMGATLLVATASEIPIFFFGDPDQHQNLFSLLVVKNG